jgi:hypothetical protein
MSPLIIHEKSGANLDLMGTASVPNCLSPTANGNVSISPRHANNPNDYCAWSKSNEGSAKGISREGS